MEWWTWHCSGKKQQFSLSERFGLWLAFHPFSQDGDLSIVAHWLLQLGDPHGLDAAARDDALRWAWQFARDSVGRHRV